MCKLPSQQFTSRRTHQIVVNPENANDTTDSTYSYEMFRNSGKPYSVMLGPNDCNLEKEIDTGASPSIISEQTYLSLWPIKSCHELQPTTVKLLTYTKEPFKVLALITVHVCYKEQRKSMPLYWWWLERV